MRQSKYCNCQTSSDKYILKTKVNYSFCEKCGCVLLKDSGKEGETIYYTLKTKQKRLPYDISPITIIKNMKKKTEENYPFIYQEYNINKEDKRLKEKFIKSINNYAKHRKMLLLKLQKLVKTFDYCDLVFYQCLFFLDTYLSHNMAEDLPEKTLLYYLIGYFLCSVKFRENDIYEPSLDAFFDLSKGIYLSTEKIAYYEVHCLKTIQYNVFSYSAYDWVTQLISNGIVFNCEINKDNEIILIKGHRHSTINAINKHVIKLLLNLTSRSLFFKYAPMQLAFSLIQIAREKFINKNMIRPKLFLKLINIYGIDFDDYKNCFDEIKNDLKEEYYTDNDDKNKKEEETRNINNLDENDSKTAERRESSKPTNSKYKNIYVPNKMRSSNALISVNENDLLQKYNDNKDNNNDLDLSNNEIGLKIKSNNNIRNNKPMKHLSINCSVNAFNSNENLPFIDVNNNSNGKYSFLTINEEEKFDTPRNKNHSLNKKNSRPSLKDLKHIKANQNRFNSIESKSTNTASSTIKKDEEGNKKNIKKKSKFFSNKNLDFKFNNDIELRNSNIKLTSKKLPQISVNLENFANNNEESNVFIKNNKNKKHYKLKSINIKTSFQ